MTTKFLNKTLLTMLATGTLLSACGNIKPEEESKLFEDASSHFKAIPTTLIDKDKNKELIALGKELYLEKALSANGTISCNSCHGLDKFGVDNEATSPGHDGRRGDRNAPTSFNAALHLAQFWDGRAPDVEAQALGPLLNPIEHGLANEKAAMKKLKEVGYEAKFKTVFKGKKNAFTFKNIGVAIGAFERTLLTPSRFDDYLNGDKGALNNQEKRGLKKFMEVGCTTCHNGPALGGELYQKLGLEVPYPTKDKGRFNVTKDPEDIGVFKVPSLRNIEKTFPYFHDGSLKTLDEVIPIMAKHQLGVALTGNEVQDVKAFLGSLTAYRLPQ